jgi:hypothetical protein
MGLQTIRSNTDPDDERRVWERRRQNQKRADKMNNAQRRSIYLRPLTSLFEMITALVGRS